MATTTKPVRVEPELIRVVRSLLIQRLAPQMEPVRDEKTGLIAGWKNEAFVRRFGVAMEEVSDTEICNWALMELTQAIHRAPPGKSGVKFLDEFPSKPVAAGA